MSLNPPSMRASAALLSIILTTAIATAPSPTTCPFVAPIRQQSSPPSNAFLELFRRQQQGGCQIGYTGCTNLGQPNVCCIANSICTPDAANHVACCPNGALCTGTIGSGAAGTTGTGVTGGAFVFGSATTAAAATTTGNFLFPSSTTPAAATPTITASPQTTVPNAPYPFVYIPTSFANAAVCSSYYTSCQSQFSSCTAALGGGVNGVTVSGGGAGITVQGATATGSAAAICSGLSTQACYNLQLSNCPPFGTAAATGSAVVVNVNAAGRGRDGMRYGIGAGVAIGLAGQVLG